MDATRTSPLMEDQYFRNVWKHCFPNPIRRTISKGYVKLYKDRVNSEKKSAGIEFQLSFFKIMLQTASSQLFGVEY